MVDKSFAAALADDSPVLFVYIGWTELYDGSELPEGAHAFLKERPEDAGEARAFAKRGGLFRCGIGHGEIAEPGIHIVFVARRPREKVRRIVGVYAGARPRLRHASSNWWDAETRHARIIPALMRPALSTWPGDMGMRRWASKHPALLKCFNGIRDKFPGSDADAAAEVDQTYADLEMQEGAKRLRLVVHRAREADLRAAKLAQVLAEHSALKCEVPGCGFDFAERYGKKLGEGFAHVHHLKPLGGASEQGRPTRLADLAVVCANCHAMIHRDGECRSLKSLRLFRQAGR